ncbi:hypothetical protein A8C32_05365 [Flavivirga aquatica]|uniref:Uncharacterized protein n=1 Tax=Flavivirga aquatica TaxID=1849968 RepID=A0A1E5SHN6_9FLAO|nr:hypothetical protein [Flavivirga aquatica]OEJ98628.1 hypothetical protein A8C32_05365 [Flavivirga aquatica]
MKKGYHTQEYRPDEQPLENPIKCLAKNAWLGIGYYFWTDIQFAHYWGEDFKKNYRKYPGYYTIYEAEINTDNFIDTVFDEGGYDFFKENIEKAFLVLKKQRKPITLETVNRFLSDEVYSKLAINGIIYDDKPMNKKDRTRIYSDIPDLYYVKRIQMVCFDLKIIDNFALYLDEQS